MFANNEATTHTETTAIMPSANGMRARGLIKLARACPITCTVTID